MAKGEIKEIFKNNMGLNNPVFVQILGICSTLAVTNYVKNTLFMTAALIFVTGFSNLTLSLLRKTIPSRVRIMAETLIIAVFVIIVDIILRAYFPEIWQQLGPYVGLIITNCIIMGRAEAFALNNKPIVSFVDGLTSGMGYAFVLIIISVFRELLGSGSLLGFPILDNLSMAVFGEPWTKWSIMVMAPGAFFMLAIFIWIVKGSIMNKDKKEA